MYGMSILQPGHIFFNCSNMDSSMNDYCNVLSKTNDGKRIAKGIKYTDNKGLPQLMFKNGNAETAYTLQK